jgi:hypothetical protein
VLLLDSFCLLGLIRLLLILCPFRYVAAQLSSGMLEPNGDEMTELDEVRRVGWAIGVAVRYTPWESKCLVQAIVGKILLRRRHIHNILYLGVARNIDKKMIAHAWLQASDITVTGGLAENDFTVVAVFEDH